jgi:hypothetical protein
LAKRRAPFIDRRDLLRSGAGALSAGAGVLSPAVSSPRWGASFRGVMPPTAGVRVPLLDLPGDLTAAELLTVNVSSSRNIGSLNGDFRLRIMAGIGATTNSFDADLGEGVQFSIVAQTLRLELVSFAPSLGGTSGAATYDPANGIAEVIAQVVRGGFGRGVPLTFTEPSFRLDPSASRTYQIPPFARRFFIASNIDAADVGIASWALRSPANANFGDFMSSWSMQQFLPVPAGFNSLRIDHNLSAGSADYTPIWELAL